MDDAVSDQKTIHGDDWHVPEGLDEDMIRNVVHTFYDDIRNDDLLGSIFEAAIPPERWQGHLEKLCDFWSSMLLRSSRYDGQLMRPHLRLEGLGDEHILRWLAVFRNTVERICPPNIAGLFMDRAVKIAQGVHLAIARNKGETPADIGTLLETGPDKT